MTIHRPRVFDGFCKAGGAGEGYLRAGFDVVSMDIEPQPNNPHDFRQGDIIICLKIDREWFKQFDLLHFSPPCQGYTEMRHAHNAKPAGHHPRLIGEVRALAQETGLPYVIENVRDALWDMQHPLSLRGDQFALAVAGVGRLHRERFFEANWPLVAPPDAEKGWFRQRCLGVYGDHVRCRSKSHGGRGTNERGWMPEGWTHRMLAGELMGINWMEMDELSEAIPPAYTEWVGRRFRAWRGI